VSGKGAANVCCQEVTRCFARGPFRVGVGGLAVVIGLLTAIPAVAQTPSVKTQTVSIKLSSPTGDTNVTDTNSRGMVSVAYYSVLVSSKKMVGDGYCSIGDTCWIVDLLDSRPVG
jgi:hypothetical protein